MYYIYYIFYIYILYILFFFFENRAVCEIMWKRWQNRAGRRRLYDTCALSATNTHRIYVILIASSPQQLYERASALRATLHVHCLS